MEIPNEVWVVGGVAGLVVVALIVLYGVLVRRVRLTPSEPGGEGPEWMRTTPPPETVAATRADGEGIALYDHDPGEMVAAPFVEQIEDMLRARLSADPALAAIKVDLGTTPGGGLEIRVGGERYTEIDLIPDERLRRTLREVVQAWDAGGWKRDQPEGDE